MARNVYEGGNKLNITGTNSTINSNSSQKYLLGIFVAQASNTPTLTVADASGNIANQFTPVAPTFYRMPCQIQGILTVTIGGTVDCTIFYGTD